MANNIVTVQVSQTVAPTPATLQQMGALVSQGATNLGSGNFSLLTELADLTPLLTAAAAVTSITRTSSTATVTTTAPHGYTVSDVVPLTIAGASPAAYNGTFQCTITGASTFTYTVSGTPSTPATGSIVWTPEDVAELVAMATTFFGQGNAQAVYVLELGEGTAAEGVTALATYITANPNSNYVPGATGFFYAYLLPRYWAAESTYLTFLAGFENPTSKTYFFTTMTTGNYTTFTALMKCVVGMVEAPSTPTTEFSLAAAFYQALVARPSATNRVPPFSFRYLFGVTPYPTKGNSVLLAALLAASVNFVGTGAEGGISTAILRNGTTKDGRGFDYWYSLDWIQINIDLDISNAVINGSNNPINPLYYNQEGINRLQQVGFSTLSRAVTFGLANGVPIQVELDGPAFSAAIAAGAYNGKLVINAVPFLTYSAENPSDYRLGEYDGFAVLYVTQNGFIHILFNVNVSDFVAQ